MSIDGDLDRRRRLSAAAFVSLLCLSVFWPSPITSTNLLCCNAPLSIDDLSFLGREAPSWDVVFWWIGGLMLLAILQSGVSFRAPKSANPGGRLFPPPRFLAVFAAPNDRRRIGAASLASVIVIALTWRFGDLAVTAWAEAVQSDMTEAWIRIANRLGGGMNPALIVIFFFAAGVAYRYERWVNYAIGMAIAGAGAGIAGQIVKFAVGRTRPELWLGPFRHARSSANSFPSGHTIGAFALAGVLLFASRNWPLRIVAVALACGVGVARILAFRHWASDVVASACFGLIAAAIVTAAIPAAETTTTVRSEPSSSIR